MYGLILSGFSSYLIHKYGEDAWDNIRRLANIDNSTFAVHQVYPEQLLGRVAKKAFSTLGKHFVQNSQKQSHFRGSEKIKSQSIISIHSNMI